MAHSDVVRWLTAPFADLAGTGDRLLATLAVLTALALAVVVLPWALRRARATVDGRVRPTASGHLVRFAGVVVPRTTTELVLRVGQGIALAAGALVLAVTWDLAGPDATGPTDGPWPTLPIATDVVALATTLALLVLAAVVSDWLRLTVDELTSHADQVTEHQAEILLRSGQLGVLVSVGAAIGTVWNVDLSGLLVGAGFLGIVVGLAARQTLGSLLAGFVLMFSRPFTIGDWVAIGDNEGIVTEITIFNTRLRTVDGEFLVLPNDRVSDSPITNRSREGRLRLRTEVSVDYEADLERAADVAMGVMTGLEVVADEPDPVVVRRGFGESAVVLELRYWIDDPTPRRKWDAVSAVVEGVRERFEAKGIEIPFPQRTISTRGDASDGPPVARVDGSSQSDGDGRPADEDGDLETEIADEEDITAHDEEDDTGRDDGDDTRRHDEDNTGRDEDGD